MNTYYKFIYHGNIEPARAEAIYNSFLPELLESAFPGEDPTCGFDIHLGIPEDTNLQWLLEGERDDHLEGCPVIGWVVDNERFGFGYQRIFINKAGIVEFEPV